LSPWIWRDQSAGESLAEMKCATRMK
jgi:hypothetical protein